MENHVQISFEKLFIPLIEINTCVCDLVYNNKKYRFAYPLKAPLDIYLSPKFIGKKGFLSVDQIKELANNPLCTVGAHTMNHTKLRLERDSFKDMYESKVTIERIIGKEVNHLAYPYGRADSISRKVRREAEKAGYKTATCTIPTKVPNAFDRWYIPRIAVW